MIEAQSRAGVSTDKIIGEIADLRRLVLPNAVLVDDFDAIEATYVRAKVDAQRGQHEKQGDWNPEEHTSIVFKSTPKGDGFDSEPRITDLGTARDAYVAAVLQAQKREEPVKEIAAEMNTRTADLFVNTVDKRIERAVPYQGPAVINA